MNLFKFFSFSFHTHNERRQADVPLCGRSMVEMLGVLAIIGVLSVGAISGYSKAMLKYKLNKFSESMNMLINNALQTTRTLPRSNNASSWISYAEIFDKLGLIPDGISLYDKIYMRDIFNHNIWLYSYPNFYGIGYSFSNNNQDLEICRTLFYITKENRHELNYVQTSQFLPEDEDGNAESLKSTIYGDRYCTGNRTCLKNITLDEIDTACRNCYEGSTCVFYITWLP